MRKVKKIIDSEKYGKVRYAEFVPIGPTYLGT